jgi:glycerophosphoryl diester phosphodiesterase
MNSIEITRSRILAHRGLWAKENEKNSLKAIRNAFNLGFGVEIDLREFDSNLVLSHDFPSVNSEKIEHIDEVWKLLNSNITVAYNIKEDGLSNLLKQFLDQCNIHNQFAFDMSVSESVKYKYLGIETAVRVSEIEPVNLEHFATNDGIKKIWLDSFKTDWWIHDLKTLEALRGSQIFIVSPELHGRDPQKVWSQGKSLLAENFDIYICTDHPVEVAKIWS